MSKVINLSVSLVLNFLIDSQLLSEHFHMDSHWHFKSNMCETKYASSQPSFSSPISLDSVHTTAILFHTFLKSCDHLGFSLSFLPKKCHILSNLPSGCLVNQQTSSFYFSCFFLRVDSPTTPPVLRQ